MLVRPSTWRWTRRPFQVVLVVGPSMVPTLRSGDLLVVRRGGRSVRPGDLVVAHFPSMPDRLVVKRAVRAQPPGWWIESDNPLVTDDSRRYGPADVVGRVIWRYWPPRRTGRLDHRQSQP